MTMKGSVLANGWKLLNVSQRDHDNIKRAHDEDLAVQALEDLLQQQTQPSSNVTSLDVNLNKRQRLM